MKSNESSSSSVRAIALMLLSLSSLVLVILSAVHSSPHHDAAAAAAKVSRRSRRSTVYGRRGTKRQLSNSSTSPLLVGAYYYPWYSNDFHNGLGFIRDCLNPRQMPVLGKYESTDESVIRQHLQWCMDSNINLLVMSWWGRQSTEARNIEIILDYMSAAATAAQDDEDSSFPIETFKTSMLYETTTLVKQIDGNPSGRFDTSGVEEDIKYMAENYFNHPNYLFIDGKPVIVVYITRFLYVMERYHPYLLQEVVGLMKQGARAGGYNDIYIIGDHAMDSPNDVPPGIYPPFEILDAITNYDVFGSMEWPIYGGNEVDGRTRVQFYDDKQRGWKGRAAEQACGFIPSVTPGFNNGGLMLDVPIGPLSRRLAANDAEGSLLKELLTNALKLVDPSIGMLLITSFNEFHEDTMIEPFVAMNGATGNSTTEPANLTMGLEYEAYGTLYLDIVLEYTTDAAYLPNSL